MKKLISVLSLMSFINGSVYAQDNLNYLSFIKMEVSRYQATKFNSTTREEMCHAIGSAETSLAILVSSGLSVSSKLALLNLKDETEFSKLVQEVIKESQVCLGL